MGGKAIIILLLLAGALGAVLYFTDEQPPVEDVVQATVFEGRSMGKAKRIRWQFAGKQAIEIGRGESGPFMLQEPIQDLASSAYLRQAIVAWDSAQMRATPFENDEVGQAKTGLDKPQLKLTVVWPDDTRIDVEVGDNGPGGDTRFLRRDGKIWEGGIALLESLRANVDDLRERGVFRTRPAQLNSLVVDQLVGDVGGKRETLHLERDGQDWQLRAPVAGRADPDGAMRFLTAVVSMRVDYFQPAMVRRPQRDPEIRIDIDGARGKENIELWLEQGQLWGSMPGRNALFVADNRQYTRIFKNAADQLRARILVPAGEGVFEQLEELILDSGQGSEDDRIRFVRQDQKWRLVEPVEYAVRATPINESLNALEQLVARQFVQDEGETRPRAEDPRYGLTGAKRFVVSTRRGRDRVVHTLWFGAEVVAAAGETAGTTAGDDGALLYAARADEPDNVALVPKRPVDLLKRPWTDYCDKQIIDQPALLERLELRHRDGRTRAFGLEDGKWRREGVAGEAGLCPEVGEFANDVLRDFVGRSVVDMQKGFDEQPDWVLEMKRGNGDVLGLVKLWDRGPTASGELLPLVAKSRSEEPVGFALGTRNSRFLRELWQ
ncbi:MAG: DUF4340 domain-containing protein [Planctomycetota bacterium]